MPFRSGEACEDHDQAGQCGGDEREQVVEYVLEGALDIEAGPVGLADQPRGGDIHDDADQGGDQHHATGHVRWRDQAPDGLVGQPGPSSNRVSPLAWADRISARFQP